MDKAFEILAAEHRPMALVYARALTGGDAHEAEDLVQESLLAAFRNLDRFETGNDFGAWLRGIIRNKALESRRAAGRRRWVVDTRVVEGMEEVFALFDGPRSTGEPWSQRLELMRDCIRRLGSAMQAALADVYTHGMSLAAAAEAAGSTPAAVGQRLSRAREAVRRCVQERTDKAGEP